MKKQFFILLTLCSTLMISCCGTSQSKTTTISYEELEEIKTEHIQIEEKVITLESLAQSVSDENKLLKKKLLIYESGNTPTYTVTFKLKQSRVSLDLNKHAKDALNTIKFNMAVSEEFYNSVSIGTNVINNFRAGSFIVNGDLGHWKMRVIDKNIS